MFERLTQFGSDMKSTGFVERLSGIDRRVGLAAVGLFVGIILLLFFLLGGGDDGEADAAGGEDQIQAEEERIAQSVAATIEAMPTPTPEPTPDLAATLQASLAQNREFAPPVVALNPLDRRGNRDPYLSPAELRYFREMGPRLWIYTRVWLHIQRVLSLDISDWSSATLGYDVGMARGLLDSAPDRPNFSSGEEINPVVLAYADSIESGLVDLKVAVRQLSEAESILAGQVGHPERDDLLRISRDVEILLSGFDSVMSSYGCSVCGELFRREGSR